MPSEASEGTASPASFLLVSGFLLDAPGAESKAGTASHPDAFRHSAARRGLSHRPVPRRASDMDLGTLLTDVRQMLVPCHSKVTVRPWINPGSTFPLPPWLNVS